MKNRIEAHTAEDRRRYKKISYMMDRAHKEVIRYVRKNISIDSRLQFER